MRRNFEKSHGMRRPRPSQIKAETLRNSNAAQESARVEGVGRVEAEFDRFHEGKGIARSAPSVEGGNRRGAVKEDEGATDFLDAPAQACQSLLKMISGTFETEPAEAGGVHQQFPHEV